MGSIIERRRIESSVRFQIVDLFRNEGFVIAFPQRDVHIYEEKLLGKQETENKEN